MAQALKSQRRSRFGAWPWIGPAVVMILVVVVWPAFEMARTSFQNVDMTGINKGWAGLRNYQTLLRNPDLPGVLIRTIIWVFGVVLVTTLVSLPIAQLLNSDFPGRKVVRWATIVPWAASVVMTATAWKWILDGFYGVMNNVFIDLHLIKEPVDWLGTPKQAFLWLMIVAVFVSIPFTSFVILAGLSTIPHDILEAAKVDGASGWAAYRTIIFPLLRPSLMVAAVINLINVFNSFPIIWVMTTGGPGYETDTTTTLAYKISFRDQDIGQSASMATVNFVIILVFIIAFLKVSKWREQSE